MNLPEMPEQRMQVEQFLRKHHIGLLTLLFTDMVDSSRLKEELGDVEAVALIQRHHALAREILGGFMEGEEISTAGDSFFIVFTRPSDAVVFALLLHAGLRRLSRESAYRVMDRVGIHVGEVVIESRENSRRPKDLYGIQVDTCARVMSLAEGGQTLLSRSSFDNARQVLKRERIPGVAELSWLRHGLYSLKGLADSMEICEVGETGLAPLKPPPDTDKGCRKIAPVFTGETGLRTVANPAPLAFEERRNLGLLRDRVKQFWIDGVLEQTTLGQSPLTLGKKTMAEAVEHPWERVLELPDQTSRILPAGKSAGELFEEVGRSLLILGEPGAGKTISLLQLARDLIARSEEDSAQPVPVVFNLSTWSEGSGTLLDWLIGELKAKYYIPARISRPWLEQSRLAILLDGLDEVATQHQARCVEAINRLVQDVGLPGLAACCRLMEYTALPVRLKLGGAICLQPLTRDQVEELLASAGPALTSLQAAVKQDAALLDLAKSPLMLGVMSLAYENMSATALAEDARGSPESRRKRIFDTYLERMFERKGRTGAAYSPAQTTLWLSWLAEQMRQHSQSLFLIEQLQPTWLSNRRLRWFYFLATRLFASLLLVVFGTTIAVGATMTMVGDAFGLTFGLWFGIFWVLSDKRVAKNNMGLLRRLLYGLGTATLAGLFGAWTFRTVGHDMFLIWGPLVGLCLAVHDGWEFEQGIQPAQEKALTGSFSLADRIKLLFTGAAIGFVGGLFLGGIIYWQRPSPLALGTGGMLFRGGVLLTGGVLFPKVLMGDLSVALAMGLPGGILTGMILKLRGRSRLVKQDIEPVEGLTWSWMSALKGGLGGVLFGMCCGIIWYFHYVGHLSMIKYYALLGAGAGLILGGLRGDCIKTRTRPNQGTLLSARNMLIGGTAVLLVIAGVHLLDASIGKLGLAWKLSALFPTHGGFPNWSGIWRQAVLVALVGVLPACAWYGGLDVVQHYVLRLAVVCDRRAPVNYAHFLDHCVRHVFLQKVGGGYVFMHRMLLEHFSGLQRAVRPSPKTHHRCALFKASMVVAILFFLLIVSLRPVLVDPFLKLRIVVQAPHEVRSSIRARDRSASPGQIDLSAYYNGTLHDTGLAMPFLEIPPGLKRFAGIEFDVRGCIKLCDSRGLWFPAAVKGIRIGIRGRHIHLLHGALAPEKEGAIIGKYVFHYANGLQREVPIVYGEDVRAFWYSKHAIPTTQTTTKSTVAWTGTHWWTARMWDGLGLQVFKSAWENPWPEVEIRALDFVSAKTKAPPFLIAITAE